MIVYLLEHKTWSSTEIMEIYLNESEARKKAELLEYSKIHSDGYMEYYVRPMKVVE